MGVSAEVLLIMGTTWLSRYSQEGGLLLISIIHHGLLLSISSGELCHTGFSCITSLELKQLEAMRSSVSHNESLGHPFGPLYRRSKPVSAILADCYFGGLPQALSRARRPPSEGGPPIPPIQTFLPNTHSLLVYAAQFSSSAFGAPPATPFGQVKFTASILGVRTLQGKLPLRRMDSPS